MTPQPRKVLTAAQMGAVDRATIESGIPGIILMENAAHRCVEFLAAKFGPLNEQCIVIVCGKGNNGGDGLAIARQIFTRFHPRELFVVLIAEPSELKGDAALNYRMLLASGVQPYKDFGSEMRTASLVIDAVLGTGLNGPARGEALNAIREINTAFPLAKVFAVDIPSGLPDGEFVRADATVTFTAPKVCHALPPASHLMGDLVVAPIGSPPSLYEDDPTIRLALVTPAGVAGMFAPRERDSNKGRYGHVLVVAGAPGKSGAAVMAGLAALRAGAGLVTVACPEAARVPELMTEPLSNVMEQAERRSLVAIGPGLGTSDETRNMVRQVFAELRKPMVVDADALNCLAGTDWKGGESVRVLTPHPGEMSRLTGKTVAEVQADRVGAARSLATERHVTVVLKGDGTLIAFPDGRVWINPTGSPAMATGGSGDILTGMVAGLLAQFPDDADRAVAAAVYLHGLAGEIAARHWEEQPVIATDLLQFLGEGIREIRESVR